jgi:hypothetical protein
MNEREFKEVLQTISLSEEKITSMGRFKKDSNGEYLNLEFSKYEVNVNNPNIRMTPVSRRSLGYISLLSRFMKYFKTSDIFTIYQNGKTRFFDYSCLFYPFQVFNLKRTKNNKTTYIKISNILLNLIGLRNMGRYEIKKNNDIHNTNLFEKYTLAQTPDIFVLSFVKKSLEKKEIKIIKEYKNTYYSKNKTLVKTIFKIDPKNLVLMINKDTLMNTVFMETHYSRHIRKQILRFIQVFELKFEKMFGFKPEILYVDNKEIYKHIRLDSEPDNVTSLTKIMEIDQEVKQFFIKQEKVA